MAVSSDKKRIMVTVDRDIEEKLKEYAKKDSRTLSNYVSMLINKHIEEKEKENG